MGTPKPGHEALRRGRYSHETCDYFITFCVESRKAGLCNNVIFERFRRVCDEAETDGSLNFRCGILMPDHVHVLFRLGDRLRLGQMIGRIKAKTSVALKDRDMRWQQRYFDHRMRPEGDRLPVFLYIYLNPYRKGLIQPEEVWPYFWCSENDWRWFQPLLTNDCPYPEWLE